MIKEQINFDKKFWPKSGTLVGSLPKDLNDLWDDFEDQASTFVAEALIANPPTTAWLRLDDGNEAYIETALWEVGQDCLTIKTNLSELFESDNPYDFIRSDEQAEDVKERLVSLERLEKTIQSTKQQYNKLLSDYEKKTV